MKTFEELLATIGSIIEHENESSAASVQARETSSPEAPARPATSNGPTSAAAYIAFFMIVCCSLLSSQQKPAGTIGGYMFGDFYYNVQRDSVLSAQSNVASQGAKAFQAFQLRRIYLTYDNEIGDDFTSRFRLEADQASLSSDSKISVAVKDASLRWNNVFKGSELVFGIQPTPAFEISESVWGYRSLEKTIMDLRGIVPSRDIGVSVKGKFVENGAANYWLMVANGNSNKPENDKYKRFYGMLHFKPFKGVQATLSADYLDRSDIANPAAAGEKVSNSTSTASAFIGWNSPDNSGFGLEGFVQRTLNGFNPGGYLTRRETSGISAFGRVRLAQGVILVSRYDYFDPNTDAAAMHDSREYVVAGVSLMPNKNVSIIPNVLYEMYEHPATGAAIAPSVTGRITIHYVFL